MYTPKMIRNARRFLTANSIVTEGLTDTAICERATKAGWTGAGIIEPAATVEPVEPAATVEPIEPIAPNTSDTAAALATLLATLTPAAPAAPAIDENAIRAIVKSMVDPIVTLQVLHETKPAATIKGAHKALPKIIKRLQAGYHVYTFGPAGAGKTTLASQAAEALQVPFHSTGALLQKYELTGYMNAGGEYVETSFYDAYKNGGVFLFDEIDASNPTAVIAFNQALANKEYTFPNGLVKQHPDFYCIAAANTNGNGATANYKRQALDGATLDRFSRIELKYDTKLELRLAEAEYARLGGDVSNGEAAAWVDIVQTARKDAEKAGIIVVISPRSSIRGAGLLAMGETRKEAMLECFGNGLSKDQISQLNLRGI
jgi:cobaltochelatase CobS